MEYDLVALWYDLECVVPIGLLYFDYFCLHLLFILNTCTLGVGAIVVTKSNFPLGINKVILILILILNQPAFMIDTFLLVSAQFPLRTRSLA